MNLPKNKRQRTTFIWREHKEEIEVASDSLAQGRDLYTCITDWHVINAFITVVTILFDLKILYNEKLGQKP